MEWFRNKEKLGTLDEARISGKAQQLADFILDRQSRWAARLNAKAQDIGMKRTKILLSALLLGFGCYCMWLVASAFF